MDTHHIRTPKDSEVVMTELVLPNDTNQLGNLLGGRLMHWVDIAAALVAMRHSGKVCVTASVDEISFFEPIKLGHVVTLYARANRAFRTSIEVGVRVLRQDPLNNTEAHTSSAYLTFVAIDNYGKPIPIPALQPATEEDKRRYEEAAMRRQQRLQHRKSLQEFQQNVVGNTKRES